MLKKFIVGILVTTVAVAVGASVYNTRAASSIELQAEAPKVSPLILPDTAVVETTTADIKQGSQMTAHENVAQLRTNQSQGFESAAGSGGRRFGQGAQTDAADRVHASEANGSSTFSNLPQGGGASGTGNASGRPAWAGGNGNGQGAGGNGTGDPVNSSPSASSEFGQGSQGGGNGQGGNGRNGQGGNGGNRP